MKKYILTFIATFVATGVLGSILGVLYYGPEQAKLSKLFPPGIVNEIPDPVFMLISGIALMLLMIISFDKMGVNNLKNGAVTGAWYGALIFTFFGFLPVCGLKVCFVKYLRLASDLYLNIGEI